MATIDNYLRCVEYQGHEAHPNYPGFTHFFRADNNHWYFAMVAPSGRVLLKSEGYTSEAGRNNGIESVNRNRDIAERWVVRQDADGQHWRAYLLAGNKQEIGVSCGYDTEDEAKGHYLMANTAWVEPAAAAPAEKKAAAPRDIDDYLPCDAYAGMPDLAEKGFSGFYSEEKQEWYFAMLDHAGNVLLRSEGYKSEAARDNGVQSVIRNRDIRERYKVWSRPDGTWVVSLHAGNNQEIARSCPFGSEAEASAHLDSCLNWARVPPVEKVAQAAPKSEAVHDDYLPCEAYVGHDRSEKYPGFTTFRFEKDGRHFFAWVNDEGKVLLKSEGYPTTAPRDNGIESVIKNREIRERWTEKQDDGGYYLSLRAGNNIEIGRTCHYKESGAWWSWIFPVAAVVEKTEPESFVVEKKVEVKAEPIIVEKKVEVAPVVVPPVVVETKREEPKVVVTPPKVTAYSEPAREKVEAPVVVPPVAAESNGCMRYWWLLPLLLLLAGLLWWLSKGCNKPAVEAPPVKVEVPTPPAPAVVEPPKPAAPVCNCSGNADPLFNIPTGVEPKSLNRLGTNPEFGNSHGLTPAQFLAKLQKNAASNKADAAFLDRVFKGMGYKGFSDATAAMFSEVEIPAGTAGNMGYSKMHKTAYDRLDATGKDLLAFRIKSANGCDFHFMKTCGNHFFFCPR